MSAPVTMQDAAAGRHASVLRGLSHVPSSRSFEGRFGRMFRELPAAQFTDSQLTALAAQIVQPAEPDKPLGAEDEDENTKIPSGFTYLGQFIDHDLTFDPVSSLDRLNDPDALVDFRTPRFDLDCLYGRGPDDQPYMYQDGRFTLGRMVSSDSRYAGPDLPRAANGRAIIGDPRNDENLIVSQLHSLMLQFHNKVVTTAGNFDAAQRWVRWHYQWIVVHDFLPRVCGQDVVNAVLNVGPYTVGTTDAGKRIDGRLPNPDFRHYLPRYFAFMPVEFSVAAYRFGHSMVRPSYLINDVAKPSDPTRLRIPIFTTTTGAFDNLNGFRPLPDSGGIQWGFFFPGLRTDQRLPQPSYKLDDELVDPLGNLPAPIATNPSSLALRNLKRGVAMGLPSGQDVARTMGIPVLSDKDLFEDAVTRDQFKGSAPLWYYILRESNVTAGASHLGPVGARIVAEVFIGLLWHDSQSYLRQNSNWQPTLPVKSMSDLVKFVGAPQ